MIEIICIFLLIWCLYLQHLIKTLQRAVIGLQAAAIQQCAINMKTANVQSILEDVNTSLKKIVETEKV